MLAGLFLFVLLGVGVAIGDVIDTTFNAHIDTTTFGSHRVTRILVLPDVRMIASGRFTKYNGRNVGTLIRVNPDGTLDDSFDTETFDTEIDGDE